MEKLNMVNRIIDLLQQFEASEGRFYRPTEYGTGAVYDAYINAKSTPVLNNRSLLEGFKRHPAYDGDGKIVLSEKMYRSIDRDTIRRFGNWVASVAPRAGQFSVGDKVIVKSGEGHGDYLGAWTKSMDQYVGKEMTVSYVPADGEFVRFEGVLEIFDTSYVELADTKEEKKGMEKKQIEFFKSTLADYPQYLDEEHTEAINKIFPFLKAHVGAKTSRSINKILQYYGVWDNTQFTNFADAINPLAITRWTVLSINPIDYLTMSFGHKWASCHSIDKTNRRETCGRHYEGMYSAGTVSYMLDSVSLVMYTVDGSYKGTNYELQDKIHRQMFHVGEDKIIQGRLYPNDQEGSGTQGTSETLELYKQFRAIVQRVISECFDLPNYWTVSKGTDICDQMTYSAGLNYPDYVHYSNCNVSFLKREDGTRNENVIKIGEMPICFECGETHDKQSCIVCGDCLKELTCDNCGAQIYGDHITTYDGNVYCDETCAEEAGYVFCYNDEEWHLRNRTDVMWDDYREEYFFDEYSFEDAVIVDGRSFINAENAMNAGYVIDRNGEWRCEGIVHYCEECGEYVDADEFDFERQMCRDCAERLSEEEEGIA